MERLNESRMGAVITEAYAVSLSKAVRWTPHARHGVTLLLGLDGEVTVTGAGGARIEARAVLVPPDVLHEVACPGPTLSLMFDPERAPAIAGHARLRQGPTALEGHLLSRLAEAASAHRASLPKPDVLGGLALESGEWLSAEAPRRSLDARVARVLEALRDPTADRASALARTGVSQAHLRDLFVRDVGLPIRTFQLWRRVLVGAAAFSRVDATSAAHAAGFADLAHFSRSCRRMLGASPTELGGGLLVA